MQGVHGLWYNLITAQKGATLKYVVFLMLLLTISCKHTEHLWYNNHDGEIEMSDEEKLVVPGMRLRILAKTGASSRTKNRIRERGAWGFVLKQRTTCWALDNRPSLFLMGQEPGKLAGDQWLGWLPEDEIEFEQWVEGMT